jgi:hypothetical protein
MVHRAEKSKQKEAPSKTFKDGKTFGPAMKA